MADNGNPTTSTPSSAADKTNNNRQWVPYSVGRPQLSAIEAAEAEEDYALAYSNAAGQLHFVTRDPSKLVFKAGIYNTEGILVGQFYGNETFKTDNLARGVYLVSWKFGGRQHSGKFIKR